MVHKVIFSSFLPAISKIARVLADLVKLLNNFES